jgi:23S rRNA (pseudouridine1915-N3)-methyltransferase
VGRELVVAWLGRHQKRDRWETLCEDYRGRVARFAPVRDLPVRARAVGEGRENEDRLRREGEALLRALPSQTLLIALDRQGEMLSSERWATELRRLWTEWPHALAFALGSDLGLGQEVLRAARFRWSLGPLTLPHELARLVLYEQLYRALSIGAGMHYHRGPL